MLIMIILNYLSKLGMIVVLTNLGELIDGLGRIHSKGLYHGGLGSESNYVFIGECLKVINIKGDLDEFNTDEDRENKKKEDITDLLGMLDNWFESILAGGKRSWLECQHFFDFVNRAKTLNLDYDVFAKKVACHPFLLEADGRMSLFVEYDRRRNAPTTRQQVAVALTSSSDFANFKSWNSTSTVNNMDSYMRGVYNHRNYSGDVEDLLRYLRNLHHHYHEHGLAAGSMEIVDRGVTTYIRGFLEVLYKNLEI
ncbi:leucine-rich repeat receptor-like protein kinase PXL2 [Prunus yedoensis var. nudiflora]|uniref:Leucine-rich repeat receptor-like protein kinase PXL2 n=1 Tax=Prunus yedoensis var. nudiflora TaxID=2094558 RepID=A0A314UYU5_PRUYE|nr:leucine-rich repeat receptor-like protein kinase PXL2 [Prunus yedoensis var. nudiflora]